MRVGVKDSLMLLNTNREIFKTIPKDLTDYEIKKLLKLIRKKLSTKTKSIIKDVGSEEELLNDLFLGLVVMEDMGCWIIKDRWDKYRQVYFSKNNKNIVAHRLSYELFIGEVNLPQVCHHCDRPGCNNPWHLFLGNQTINVMDARLKGRMKRKVELTEAEKFLLWKHINIGKKYHPPELELEITSRAESADRLFGKMK